MNYKAEAEQVFPCDRVTGMRLQNRVVVLAKKMGAKLSKRPCNGFQNGNINLPSMVDFLTEESFLIKLTVDYFTPEKLNGVITMLHELGHMEDCTECGGLTNMVHRKGYHNIEVVAWEKAFKLAQKVGFTDYPSMYQIALRSLYTYFRTEGVPERHYLDYRLGYRGELISWTEAHQRIDEAFKKAMNSHRELMYTR